MKIKPQKIYGLLFIVMISCGFPSKIVAQKLQYSRENVFITNPARLQLVADISGHHHLIHLSKDEKPTIFIYNKELDLIAKVRFPFIIPEQAEVRIIPFNNFYYFYMKTRFTREYFFWKVDSNGFFTDYTQPFNRLLASQSKNIKLGFQLIASQENLWMVYHTDLEDLEQKTMVIAQADSSLNVVFTHKVKYDFSRDEERLQQEILMFGRYLLVLKTARSGTALELMKVNLATGYTITNTFATSGYFYSQATFNYNASDTTITVSALVTEPRAGTSAKQFILVSRLNKILAETTPFLILKSQFQKNSGANFLLVDSGSKWMRLKVDRATAYQSSVDPAITVYQDLTMPDESSQRAADNNRFLANMSNMSSTRNPVDPRQAVRFTLLNKKFTIVHDSLFSNVKESYTLKADQFLNFNAGSKEYLLVAQQFAGRRRGILIVHPGKNERLSFTDLRVNERNNYLLAKARLVAGKGILIPYSSGNEAGLVKVTVD